MENENTTEKLAGTDLTTVVEYNQIAADIAAFRETHKGVVYNLTDPKQMVLAKADKKELTTARTTLEKERVRLVKPALERQRQVNEEAKRITADIVALEEPIAAQIQIEENKIESSRLAQLEADKRRVDALLAKIQSYRDLPSTMTGKPAVVIQGALAKAVDNPPDMGEFAEYGDQASDAHAAAVGRLREMVSAQRTHETEQAQIRADREKLARLEAEAEERRIADAERDRKEREAENARVAEIRNRIQLIARPLRGQSEWTREQAENLLNLIEAEALEVADNFGELADEATEAYISAREQVEDLIGTLGQIENRRIQEAADRAEREAQQALEAKQREAAEAVLQAERDKQAAAAKKLAEQQGAFKREQAAAAKKAEQERLAGLGLREAAQAVVDYFKEEPFDKNLVPLISDLYAALQNDANQAPTKATRRSPKA